MCTRVLLEAAVEGKPKYVSRRAIFCFANFVRLHDIAETVARMPTFKAEGHLRIHYQNQPLLFWTFPLHDAVAHHQATIVEVLIVERGASVDKQSTEHITPLAIACALVYPNLVKKLLHHQGANPNVPSMFSMESQRCLTALTKQQDKHRGVIANLPMDRGTERTRRLTEKADYILELLVKAGLTHPRRRFIRRSAMKCHLSSEMQQRLRRLGCEMRSLKILALARVRTIISRQCRGIHFCDKVDTLDVPEDLKRKITFCIRP